MRFSEIMRNTPLQVKRDEMALNILVWRGGRKYKSLCPGYCGKILGAASVLRFNDYSTREQIHRICSLYFS